MPLQRPTHQQRIDHPDRLPIPTRIGHAMQHDVHGVQPRVSCNRTVRNPALWGVTSSSGAAGLAACLLRWDCARSDSHSKRDQLRAMR